MTSETDADKITRLEETLALAKFGIQVRDYTIARLKEAATDMVQILPFEELQKGQSYKIVKATERDLKKEYKP